MIRKFCWAAVAALAAVSCSEKDADLPQAGVDDELVTFSVSVPGVETRSVGSSADSEKTINSLQVFVFNKHGVYETSATANKGQASVTCTVGEKKIVALVNAMIVANVTTYQDLTDRTVNLKDSGVGKLAMFGETTAVVSAQTSVNVEVSYLSSKVVLESVALEFANEEHKGLDFAIESVYLLNVAGDRKLVGDHTPQVWHNQGVLDPCSTRLDFLYDDVASAPLQSGGAPYGTEHYFYCYQNPTSVKTRLVIEAKIEEELYYYPIDVDVLQPNNEYSYSVKLTRLGTDTPEGSLKEGTCSVTVSIKDWVQNSSDVTI
jgi:uncharacterized protein with FMN-binding domain